MVTRCRVQQDGEFPAKGVRTMRVSLRRLTALTVVVMAQRAISINSITP